MDYNVTAIGNALLDLEYRVDEKLLKEINIPKGSMTLGSKAKINNTIEKLENKGLGGKTYCGGSAANTAIAIKFFGGSVFFTYKVNHDNHGKFFIDSLAHADIPNDRKLVSSDDPTGLCLVLVTPDAQRTMLTYLGISEKLSPQDLNKKAIIKSQYLYVEGYLTTAPSTLKTAQDALSIARENNTKIAISFSDAAITSDYKLQLDELIGDHVDLIFCNKDEILAWAQTADINNAIDQIRGRATQVLVTTGNQGAILVEKDSKKNIHPFKVDAVDTTGAGDMFAGAYLYAIANEYNPQQAAAFGNFAASRIITEFGPRLDYDYCQIIKANAANILKKS